MAAVTLWALPLAAAPSGSDRLARVCGGTVDTVNVGSHAPFFIWRCARGDPLSQERQAAPIGTRDGGPSM
jgi:hypothetical protein